MTLVPSFCPTATLETLKARAILLKRFRDWFTEEGFVEVQTPILSHDTMIDRYIEPLSLQLTTTKGLETFYLQTSPEFGMKRLLASGMDAIYQLGPVFRRGDSGPLHNVEFTMLEWYRTGHSYQEGMTFLASFIEAFTHQGPCRFLSVEQLLFEKTGLTFLSEIDDFRCVAQRESLIWPESFLHKDSLADSNDWFDFVFSEVIQPTLGWDAPTILFDYPATQSQLSCLRTVERSSNNQQEYCVAERFELFMNGVELANGYHELCDSRELRSRNNVILQQRLRAGAPALPAESFLLAAMDAGFPPSCGCALGIDRLLMLLLEKTSLDEVIPFPLYLA